MGTADHDPVPVKFPDGVVRPLPWATYRRLLHIAEHEGLTVEAWMRRHKPDEVDLPPVDVDEK